MSTSPRESEGRGLQRFFLSELPEQIRASGAEDYAAIAMRESKDPLTDLMKVRLVAANPGLHGREGPYWIPRAAWERVMGSCE